MILWQVPGVRQRPFAGRIFSARQGTGKIWSNVFLLEPGLAPSPVRGAGPAFELAPQGQPPPRFTSVTSLWKCGALPFRACFPTRDGTDPPSLQFAPTLACAISRRCWGVPSHFESKCAGTPRPAEGRASSPGRSILRALELSRGDG